jgi:two-component sensor histidine kinase
MDYLLKVNLVGYGYSLIQTSKNEIIVCNKGGIQIYKENELVYASQEDSFKIKTFSVLELPDSSLLLGTIDGLYLFKDGEYTRFNKGNPTLEKRISTLDLINGEIWVGTFDYGIVVIGQHGQKCISLSDGLSSDRIKSVLAENDSIIWIGTNKGLNKVELNKSGPIQITAYTIWDGLPSNEINDILLYEGVLWLATTKGLVSIDPSELKDKRAAPRLIVENIKVNNTDTVFSKANPILQYFQNNLSFTYTAINHYDPDKTSFFFKMEGMENDWRQTNAKTIHFDDLKYGDYSFKLKAKNTAGQWSNTYQFDFSINKHFTETLWFRAFAIVSLLALVILFFLFILYRQKKREELKRRVLVSEQKALRSQMNPHFIFNSLNSIQDIILNKKTGTASRFVVDFSALLRRILELSKHNLVSLSDELKTIELYLSLEKTRLSEKFDFSVMVDNSIVNRDIHIPSMIIQPLLENAIWHGIAPLPDDTKAYISVKISQAQNTIYILITDNGIGRKKSLEIEKAKSFGKATGLSNINERIKLANRIYKTNINLQISDLSPEKNFTGTKAQISFAIIE